MFDSDKLQRLAKKKGVTTPYQLSMKLTEAGYQTSESQARRLWSGKSDPKISTLGKLATVLDCEPSELLKRRVRKR
jgi:transcriptional regulator with XRE-family HTH domain